MSAEMSGAKLKECVGAAFPELDKIIKKMLRAGDIKINGDKITKDCVVEAGDLIEIYMPVEFERYPLIDIVYEDKNIIVANKQPGTAVTALQNRDVPDLLSMVINHMKSKGEYSEEVGAIPFACYKLDIYTGGLVIFAKNGDFFEVLRKALAERRIKRHFQAIVKGSPKYENGEFQHFYVKESDNKYKVANRRIQGAVPIYTKYDIIKTNGKYSLLNVEPVTQYMNQERAHLEAAGYPILGDAVYGDARLNKKMAIRYQALWAHRVDFYTGTGNMLEYLNGRTIETEDINFPLVHMD